MSNLKRGRVYHISKTDKFLKLRTASRKSSCMVEAHQDVWEARKLELECLAVQGLTPDFQAGPGGHTVAHCGNHKQPSKAGSASEHSHPLAMPTHPSVLLTASLAHFSPMPKNITLNWGMYSWSSSGRSHIPGTVPSR